MLLLVSACGESCVWVQPAPCSGSRTPCHTAAGDVCCDEGTRCCAAAQSGLAADQCVPDEDACPVACSGAQVGCGGEQLCLRGASGEPTCTTSCEVAQRCGERDCCADGLSCQDGVCQAADLVVDAASLAGTLRFHERHYPPESCEAQAGCMGTGWRNTLRFIAGVRNAGPGPLRLPEGSPLLDDGRCGEGPVLRGLLRWRALDTLGTVKAEGTLDAHCFQRSTGDGGTVCSLVELAAGATTFQPSSETCGFADITDLPPGGYELELTVDPEGRIPESDETNNTVRVPLEVPRCMPPNSNCGGGCCQSADACVEGVCYLPDLSVDQHALEVSVQTQYANFPADDCAIAEECVRGRGARRLLRFKTTTPNLGNADLVMGDPEGNARFEYSSCHEHYHFRGYANYRLLDLDGNDVVTGRKQAFCLEDVDQLSPDAGPARFTCDNQGISAGWADTYHQALDCQWVDITGVPGGNYQLEVSVNPERIIPELSHANNVTTIPLTISSDPASCVVHDETCGDGEDQDCDGLIDEDCAPITGNDTCANAHPVAGGGIFTAELGASTALRPSCGGEGRTAVFSMQLLRSELVYLSTYGSTVDTVLAVYRGDCAGTDVQCADDACASGQAHLAAELAAGQYFVVVKAKDAMAAGTVRLKVVRSACSGALPITGPGEYSGDTTNLQNNTLNSCGEGRGPDQLWYMTTCPGTTHVEMDTCAAEGFDSVVEIRGESCRGESVPGSCNDDTPTECSHRRNASLVTADLHGPGEGDGLWFVVVDGFAGNARGPYVLRVTY
ncbi:MAG: lysyl oxidase family protein [Myxococcota bacterium]